MKGWDGIEAVDYFSGMVVEHADKQSSYPKPTAEWVRLTEDYMRENPLPRFERTTFTYTIRPMAVSEAKAVNDFFVRNSDQKGFEQIYKGHFDAELLQRKPYALVAVSDEGELMGAMTLDTYDEQGDLLGACITALGVEPKYQGMSLGSNFVRAAIEVTKDLGLNELTPLNGESLKYSVYGRTPIT